MRQVLGHQNHYPLVPVALLAPAKIIQDTGVLRLPERAANIVEQQRFRKGWFHASRKIDANLLPLQAKSKNAMLLSSGVQPQPF
ncbi:hypothetical protein [Phyllobacterium sp. YR620]|uniref:hypothetical protein n=1 Tax=Phyllobacterium sp. YR620 TaxID=1881066 RepID=UPI001114155E|nr:hypothetical protein [Phyllobacterium sp. YR620]